MNTNTTSRLDVIQSEITEVRKRTDKIESKLPEIEKSIEYNATKSNEAENTLRSYITELEKKIIRMEIHDRKNNLLLYGIPQSEANECVDKVTRDFFHNDLQLDKTWSDEFGYCKCTSITTPKCVQFTSTRPSPHYNSTSKTQG